MYTNQKCSFPIFWQYCKNYFKKKVNLEGIRYFRNTIYQWKNEEGKSEKIIPILIDNYKGANDEVALKGDFLKKVKKIKVGDNNATIFKGEEYRIKTSELKDGDFIILYWDNDEVKLRIRDY